MKVLCTEVSEDPGDKGNEIARMNDLENAEIVVIVGALNQMLKAKARTAQLNGARLIVVDNPEDRFNRFADESYAKIDQLKLENNDSKIVFIYNRESTLPETKKAIWNLVDKMPKAKVWVNSDYLNTRGLLSFDIPMAEALTVDNAIIFGSTPHNVEAKKIYRLPLRPFRVRGEVISDLGERIDL